MHISFWGGAHEVTGSCSLVETGSYKIVVDCGMFQGGKQNEIKNEQPLGFNAADITHVLITHAHLDHVGRLPLLIKNGYTGFFYATAPTLELAQLVLHDAYGIMRHDHEKHGEPLLYSEQDVEAVVDRFKPVNYHDVVTLKHGTESSVTVEFRDAGHIFGSSFIIISTQRKKVVFSGDVGNVHMPIVRETEALPTDLDLLVCESTYGDRVHEVPGDRELVIKSIIDETVKRGGVLMIPAFSLERTQELLFFLNDLVEHRHTLPDVPIFLDSPLAIGALRVYRKYVDYYDHESAALVKAGDDIFSFPGLQLTETKEQSKRINQVPAPKIIIAGSGMMEGGRILHHALRYLSDPRSTLMIVGYQAYGTLGRRIMEGDKTVEVRGERVKVNCQVRVIHALSAHGDQHKLFDWIKAANPKRVMFNHGDPGASAVLAEKITAAIHIPTEVVDRKMTTAL